MNDKKLHDWFGLSGVDDDENPRAKRWAKQLEVPLLLIAFWILVTWYWESTTHSHSHSAYLDWGIWLFFTIETCSLCFLVNDKINYLRSNWLNVIIIICGIPILWANTPLVGVLRGLRLLIFLSLMLQLSKSIRRILARNHLGPTLFVSCIFIVTAGYLIAGIDPSIETPADGIWWAWVTATTVGYGDIVPSSPEGRIIAGILILLGVALLSIITANTSAYFIAGQKGDDDSSDSSRLDSIEAQLNRIEQELKKLNKDKYEE